MTKNKEVEAKQEVPYWEKEQPLIIRKGALELQYYDHAGALQLRISYIDEEEGKPKIKPGVNLRKHKLQQNIKQLETLATIFNEWYQEAKELQEAENA